MRNIRLQILFAMTLSAVCRTDAAQDGAAFLNIPIGAREIAAGASTALTTGADALNWNVAGIALTPVINGSRTASFSLSHQALFSSESQLDQMSATAPLGRATLGVNVIRLAYGASETRDENGLKTGTAQAQDVSGGIGAAYNFGMFQAGLQVKTIRQQLSSESAQSLAVDAGLLSRTPVANLSVGVSVQNLGSSMKFAKESYSLPAMISVGGAYQLAAPMTLGVDLRSHLHNNDLALVVGGEMRIASALMLRAGYLSNLVRINNASALGNNATSAAGIGGLTGGLGLRLQQFSLDYAVEPFGDLGNTHIFTFSAAFGGGQHRDGSSDENKSAAGSDRT